MTLVKDKKWLDKAREVLEIEANAIQMLSQKLDDSFLETVDAIINCKGRVIVSGMGKPGFIAGKLAATFSSTGTPSICMHPADAIHGDLGMVTNQDVVILISNSGETEEVVRLLETLKKIGAKLISMVGNTQSTLARFSDIVLDVSIQQEACPMGLAPTTSTSTALALGDALAVVLMEVRGFKDKDFAFFHPGGSLGRRLLKVKDLMRTGTEHPVIDENETVRKALLLITAAKAGSCTVINEAGSLAGIFTDGDLRRHLEQDSEHIVDTEIGKIMTKSPCVIDQDQLAAKAFQILRDKKIDELVVVSQDNVPVGLLDVQDLLKAGFS